MQYQGNLNAEYVDDKNQQGQQPQAPIGQYPQTQPIAGQPVGQYYPQQYQQQQGFVQYSQYGQGAPQYYPQQYGSVANPGYQQVVMVPANQIVVMAQPMNPVVAKEISLRSYSRYFYGCNCCLGVLALIFLIVRCGVTFKLGGANVAAGVFYIISDFFFVVGVICGLYAISRYVERMLVYYQVCVAIAMVAEIIGSIIAFASYGEEQNNKDGNNDERISIVGFVVMLIILILIYGLFIRYARRIRFLMIDLQDTRQNAAKQQAQAQGQQNVFQGGGILVGQ